MNNTPGYTRETADLDKICTTYDGLESEKVLPDFYKILDQYKGQNINVLDIGCGSGRDARHVASRYGFNVTAMDGSADMITWAKEKNDHTLVSYVQDLAPKLEAVKALNKTYQVFLMSGFWMHLSPADVDEMMESLKTLAAPGAQIYISNRRGPVPEGRIMYDYSQEDFDRLAQKHGSACKFLQRMGDMKGGDGVSWDYYKLTLK